jgi:UPF0755 protein
MSKRQKNSCAGYILMLLLLGVGLAILWVAIPIFAERDFGSATPGLTSFQLRQYGLRILLSRSDLTSHPVLTVAAVPFEIEEGSSITQIAMALENAGVVKNGERFRDYLIYKGYDASIRSGHFDIPAASSALEVAELLRADNPITSFYLYPGWRAEQVAQGLIASGVAISADEFMRVVNDPQLASLPDGMKELNSLEGFLFPGEYQLRKDSSAQELVQLFAGSFASSAMPLIAAEGSRTGLSLQEIVTLASIIQRESLVSDERPLMASVFYNRLAVGMKLETDPTVQYALGYDPASNSWWKTPLSRQDLAFQSAFNTYVSFGLPPHPIANPDLDAIRAVLAPESSGYYYFQAQCDGSGRHVFSVTYEEHISHNCP